MTTMTASFASRCPSCGHTIRAGAPIAKSTGGKYVHATCAAGKAPAATPARARKSSTPRPRRSPAPAGPELRNDRDAYCVGDVRGAQLTAREIAECEARQSITATEIPGEPCKRAGDRRVAVVVIHASRISQEWADDNGYCGRYGAIVRLATEAEAASIVAERAAAAAAKADADARARAWSEQLAALTAGRIYDEGGKIDRTGAEVLHEERKGLHGTVSERWSRLADGSILVERYAYDDDRWGRWVTTEQLLEAARASERSLEDAIRGQRYSALDRAIVWLAAQAGKTPRPPVTSTLCGLSRPVTLHVRRSVVAGRIVAGSRAESGQEQVDGRWITEWSWSLDQLRELLASGPGTEVFAGVEFAPEADLGGDRLMLRDGLWIDGMGAALAQIEAAS